MSGFRVSLVAATSMIVSVIAVSLVGGGGGVATAAPFAGGSITSVCTGNFSGPNHDTYILTRDCGPTTAPITVPGGITAVDGGGFTVSATDPTGGFFNGAVLTNAAAGQAMAITNLVITGTFGFDRFNGVTGISFNDASGTVNHAQVLGITRHNGCVGCSGSTAISALGVSGPRTVTITSTTVNGYDGQGLDASGSMTMKVSTSVIGPPDNLGIPVFGVAYDSLRSGSAGGSLSDSTVNVGVNDGDSTGVRLSAAKDVTISQDTIEGTNINSGIDVFNGSTGVVISHNQIVQSLPASQGVGVVVLANSPTVTLLCNTFSGWKTNIDGAIQVSCTPLPNGTACHAYPSIPLEVQGGTAPFRWTVTSAGTAPPGLTLSLSGVVSGTPTKTGTFTFTVRSTIRVHRH